MKISNLFFLILLFGNNVFSQYLGIGTNTPTEILHVNGNLNVSNGAIKTNGQAGAVGQVLSMNTGGQMSWANPANLTDFKNFYSAKNANTSEYSFTWTVPAGVTKILVEVWGGGEGGNKSGIGGGGSGGDAGGYSRGIITVVPGQIASIILGGGGFGVGPSYNVANSGEPGHYTNLIVNGSEIQAKGGCYGCSNATVGDNFCSSCLSSFETEGQPGFDHSDNFEQISTTDFVRNKNFGNGGSAPYTFYNTGGLGERSYLNLSNNILNVMSYPTSGQVPGGGGGGCSYTATSTIANVSCGSGGAGMINIYY